MDVRKFKKPEKKGTSMPGVVAPDIDKNNNMETGEPVDTSKNMKVPDETSKDIVAEYLEYLKENDISEEDILAVLDSIITSGNVYWNFNLFDKIPVTFKIRPTWVNNMLVERMDTNPPKTFSRFSELVGLYNLAGSLSKYKDRDFNIQEKEDFEESKEFILGLPFILQSHLIKKMALFDRVVAVATSDWAVANFTKPQSEK